MDELSEYGTRRAYRMKRESFFALFWLLEPHMRGSCSKKSGSGPTKRAKNMMVLQME
jgi:hypothetical protein